MRPCAEETFEPPSVLEVAAFVEALDACGDRFFLMLDVTTGCGLVVEATEHGAEPLPQN